MGDSFARPTGFSNLPSVIFFSGSAQSSVRVFGNVISPSNGPGTPAR